MCFNRNIKLNKGGINTIYHAMCSESQRLDEQIKSLQAQLKTFPDGDFFCSQNNRYFKWYQVINAKSLYIKKSNHSLAEQLAFKKYLSLQLDDCLHEKNAIDFYLRHHVPPKAEQLLTQNSEYQRLLSPYFKPLSEELEEWNKSTFTQCTKYPESKIHLAPSGNMVRSKSEVLIDMVLYTNHIPFRYESELQLDGITIYPDFTVRNPRTGKLYYWEHFGLMDDTGYAGSTAFKLNTYISNNIIPTIDLITTYETKEHPLTIKTIENVISEYLS